MEHADVLGVGAGPVGLLAAIELTLGGVRVLLLERLAAANRASKALGIGALGSEALQRRGMAASIAAEEAHSLAAMRRFAGQNGAGQGSGRAAGHFGGLFLIRKDTQRKPERRAHLVDQHAVELMLANRGRTLGIEVRRECEVTGFVQHADGVDVEWASPTGRGPLRCGVSNPAYCCVPSRKDDSCRHSTRSAAAWCSCRRPRRRMHPAARRSAQTPGVHPED